MIQLLELGYRYLFFGILFGMILKHGLLKHFNPVVRFRRTVCRPDSLSVPLNALCLKNRSMSPTPPSLNAPPDITTPHLYVRAFVGHGATLSSVTEPYGLLADY